MKKSIVFFMLTLTVVLLTFSACGDRTQSYSYYEFICEGDMTVTHQPLWGAASQPSTLSAEDVKALLGIWGDPWEGGQTHACFNYEFRWENTTIRYCSTFGIFELAATGQRMKLSKEDRGTVESMLDTYSL